MYVTCFTVYVLYLLLHHVNISLFLKYDYVIIQIPIHYNYKKQQICRFYNIIISVYNYDIIIK